MKIAVLSGKGGAGKTFVSTNLAAAAESSVYIDCDVEEPNGRLFFKPEKIQTTTVYKLLPKFDGTLCTGCKKCVEFCHFNALVYIKDKPLLFSEVCHSCGGCSIVCPQGATFEEKTPVGKVETGIHGNTDVVTGILDLGQASGISTIKEAQRIGFSKNKTTIIDCPPGSACSVVESIKDADYCILVAEPTAFGFHNFKMVYELTQLLGKKIGVIINKQEEPYTPLTNFCNETNTEILMEIPYSKKTAQAVSMGIILSEADSQTRDSFKVVLEKIKEKAE